MKERLALAFDGILSYTNKPTILMVKRGMALCFITTVLAAWIVYLRVTHMIPDIGYASIMVSIYVLAGVLGAYVGCICDPVKGRPDQIIERSTFDG